MRNKFIEKHAREAITLSDFMADHPEIGMQEFQASSKMVEVLTAHGFSVVHPFAGLDTAFKATINEGKAIKIALLAEYDALRGMGHACGHCASGAISVLAALALNDMKDQLDAQIDLIGTPDEEMTGGKVAMADQGVFDDYDLAIMIHLNDVSAVYCGTLAMDSFLFKFSGRPAHAAAVPWEGNNALNGVRLMFDAIDMMRQHVKDDVRLHGFIQDGGKAPNIVPESAIAEYYVRAKERHYLNDINEWVKDCAKAAAMATRTTVEIELSGLPFHDLSSKPSGENVLEQIYRDLGLETVDLRSELSGSSDIGNVDYVCPAFHPLLSIGESFKPHTQEFVDAMKTEKTHQVILDGGEIMVRFVESVINDPKLLETIQNEHRANRNLI
jgi:amidohydrolase